MNKQDFVQSFLLQEHTVITAYDVSDKVFDERIQKRIDMACHIYEMIDKNCEGELEDGVTYLYGLDD